MNASVLPCSYVMFTIWRHPTISLVPARHSRTTSRLRSQSGSHHRTLSPALLTSSHQHNHPQSYKSPCGPLLPFFFDDVALCSAAARLRHTVIRDTRGGTVPGDSASCPLRLNPLAAYLRQAFQAFFGLANKVPQLSNSILFPARALLESAAPTSNPNGRLSEFVTKCAIRCYRMAFLDGVEDSKTPRQRASQKNTPTQEICRALSRVGRIWWVKAGLKSLISRVAFLAGSFPMLGHLAYCS